MVLEVKKCAKGFGWWVERSRRWLTLNDAIVAGLESGSCCSHCESSGGAANIRLTQYRIVLQQNRAQSAPCALLVWRTLTESHRWYITSACFWLALIGPLYWLYTWRGNRPDWIIKTQPCLRSSVPISEQLLLQFSLSVHVQVWGGWCVIKASNKAAISLLYRQDDKWLTGNAPGQNMLIWQGVHQLSANASLHTSFEWLCLTSMRFL